MDWLWSSTCEFHKSAPGKLHLEQSHYWLDQICLFLVPFRCQWIIILWFSPAFSFRFEFSSGFLKVVQKLSFFSPNFDIAFQLRNSVPSLRPNLIDGVVSKVTGQLNSQFLVYLLCRVCTISFIRLHMTLSTISYFSKFHCF